MKSAFTPTHRGQYLNYVSLYDFNKSSAFSQHNIGVAAFLHFNLIGPALCIDFIYQGFGDALIGFTDSDLPVSIASFA